ncbi:DUF2849 domain-containing protein [Aureimonas sp. Leaf324]|jgi:hypothetical protein|uniref:DUF2849 domain-containing protein n=1 Tax=Aureimonas sp. Leaf324 TaxID=1736336 RepID=UPI0006FAB253|nr:DUF2849 domain-containing protein [Aureimonas sp. Leaf324]KQQ79727.1 hypothetical protein ASF65_11870 [Aureimonas sp. Leaf324]
MAGDVKAGAKAKGPKLPVIMTANDLLEGEVVFLTRDGWSLDPKAALIADDADTAAWMEAEGRRGFAENRIVDPYLVEVTRDEAGRPVANHFREAIRQKGPTMLTQYGKQAEF